MQTFPLNIELMEHDARKICVSLGTHAAEECELLRRMEGEPAPLIHPRIVKNSICQNLQIILALETRFRCPLQGSFLNVQESIDKVNAR